MKKHQLIFSAFLILVSSFIFIKCEKNNSNQPEPWSETSPEVLSVSALDALEGLSFLTDTIYTSSQLNSIPGSCPNVTFFTTPDPNARIKYITTYDWSELGCTGSDNVKRKGKIIVTYTGKMDVPGNIAVNSFYGFFDNEDRLDGFQEIKSKTADPSNNFPVYDVYSNIEIKYPDKIIVSSYKSSLTRTLIEGAGTPLKQDDVWKVTGTISGNTIDDVEFTAVISKPLIKKSSCNWFDSGTIIITPKSGSQCTIDFGTGTCDNKATITKDGKTIEVQM
jgi:hypothetical protein